VSYVTGVLLLGLPVAVPAMWVVVSVPGTCISVPEMCCLGRKSVGPDLQSRRKVFFTKINNNLIQSETLTFVNSNGPS
jgi:hypothetical protein